jgi:hypothetical protein
VVSKEIIKLNINLSSKKLENEPDETGLLVALLAIGMSQLAF